MSSGQIFRCDKEMKLFMDLCSHFDTIPQRDVGPPDDLVSLKDKDCSEIASSLTKSGVSGISLAHALLKAPIPRVNTQQRMLGGSVSAADSGWLDDTASSSSKRMKVKDGIQAANSRKASSSGFGTIAACFAKQAAQDKISSAAHASRSVVRSI